MSRKYDYVAACEGSVNGFDREKDRERTRKVLRKLVRAALTHADCGIPDDIASRIARELVPSPNKSVKP